MPNCDGKCLFFLLLYQKGENGGLFFIIFYKSNFHFCYAGGKHVRIMVNGVKRVLLKSCNRAAIFEAPFARPRSKMVECISCP